MKFMILRMKAFFSKFTLTKQDGWRTANRFVLNAAAKAILVKLLIFSILITVCFYAYKFYAESLVITNADFKDTLQITKQQKDDDKVIDDFNKKLEKISNTHIIKYMNKPNLLISQIPIPREKLDTYYCDSISCTFTYNIIYEHFLLSQWIKTSKFSLSEITEDLITLSYKLDENNEKKSQPINSGILKDCNQTTVHLNFINAETNNIKIKDIIKNKPFKGLMTTLYTEYKPISELYISLTSKDITSIHFQWLNIYGFHIESIEFKVDEFAVTGYLYCNEV